MSNNILDEVRSMKNVDKETQNKLASHRELFLKTLQFLVGQLHTFVSIQFYYVHKVFISVQLKKILKYEIFKLFLQLKSFQIYLIIIFKITQL